eukprot:scaffold232_cov374-Prasinococcus_capsulatus_cf.AAC.5
MSRRKYRVGLAAREACGDPHTRRRSAFSSSAREQGWCLHVVHQGFWAADVDATLARVHAVVRAQDVLELVSQRQDVGFLLCDGRPFDLTGHPCHAQEVLAPKAQDDGVTAVGAARVPAVF